MQTARVKIGGEYAVNHNNQLARFKVTTHTAVRDSKGVANYFGGLVHLDDGSDPIEAKYPVEKMLDEYERYSELMAKKQAEADRLKAEKDARNAKRRKGADLINDFLGFEAIDWKLLDSEPSYGSPQYRKKRDYEEKLMVTIDYSGDVKIDEKALDTVIAKLGKEGE